MRINTIDCGFSGIYKIENTVNGKLYIGSAINIALRFNVHKCNFKRGKNSTHLQRAWNKYGDDVFSFVVIERVDRLDSETDEEFKKRLVEDREQFWINSFDPNSLYNLCKVAGSTIGRKQTNKSKELMSKNMKGRKPWNAGKTGCFSKEAREKMGAPKGQIPWNKGKTNVYSKNTLLSMSEKKLKNVFEKGTQFNGWAVVEEGSRHKNNHRRYLCRCVCGNEELLYACSLAAGRIKRCTSCGWGKCS